MANQFSNTVCWLILVMVFVVAGCEQEYKPDVDVLAQGPDEDALAAIPNHTSRTIKATGGLRAWTEAKKLRADCVFTFYDSDGSRYMTEQCYEIYPWSNSIRIFAEEPRGKFVCQLSEGVFSVSKGPEQVRALRTAVVNRYFAEAILNITTAPVRFLDKSVEFTKELQPVKIKGQWYYPIRQTIRLASSELGVSQLAKTKAVFYQNRDSSLVDLLWLGDVDGETFLAVRGYDYHEVRKNSVWLPAKIEIFATDTSGALQQRLVKIDFK
jgi:hypothetical protein